MTVLNSTATRLNVGVSDMKLSNRPGDIVVTHALGSCIGIAIHDPVAHVGGILHFMLPDSSVSPERAASNPLMFATTAIPAFFREAYALSAVKQRLVVKVAGGAQMLDAEGIFSIGKRNHTMMRKIFWQQGILVKAEHVGGTISRTLYLEIGSGEMWIVTGGKEIRL